MTTAIIFFNLALVPSLRSKHKPAIQTSLLTGSLNLVMAFTESTLGLWFAATATFINATLWLTLAYQKNRSK